MALLAVLCTAGAAADAARTGWHVMPAARLGAQLDLCCTAAAVNRSGTTVVVFPSAHSLRVVRRPANGSRFETAGRLRARWPFVLGLTALGNDRFLLLYATRRQLVAREIGAGGRLRGRPHVLAAGYNVSGNLLFPPSRSQVVVDSNASRAVAVWGVNHGTTGRVEGAILGRTGWSRSKVFHETQVPRALYRVIVASDDQDRFLVSLHGANGDTTARMWALAGGSQQWTKVTPPQAADGSLLASTNGATVASVNGSITAAWQDASAAIVVSTWNGSIWTKPVTAFAKTHGHSIYPVFVSDGSRAALVWSDVFSDPSQGIAGPVEATIRSSPGGSWSAPLVFPHSHGSYWVPSLNTIDTFWFTETGALAGIWNGDPITGDPSTGSADVAGLWVGYVGAGGSAATALSQTQDGTNGRVWFALARAGDLHTILWANGDGSQFSTTVNKDGSIGASQRLHLCAWPYGASNPDASAQVLIDGGAHLAGNRLACSPVLLW